MSKHLAISGLLLIAFCAGIFFYAEWQKAKFDASLPKPPAHTPATNVTPMHLHEDEAPVHHHEDVHEHTHDVEHLSTIETDADELPVADTAAETVSNADTVDAAAVETETETPQRRKLTEEDFKNPHKRVKWMRASLVKMHGNIPEIDQFLDLELKLDTAPAYTAAERLRYAELNAKLYPHPSNDRYLEYAQSLVRKYGPDMTFGPGATPSHHSH